MQKREQDSDSESMKMIFLLPMEEMEQMVRDDKDKKFSKEYTIKYVILSATENLRCFAIAQHDEWTVILSATKDLRMF